MKAALQRVEIEWDDSGSIDGWGEPSEFRDHKGLSACRTVGYLSRFDRKAVQVVQTRHDTAAEPEIADRWATAITIPRSCVRRIRVLK